jgi:hypothetical protein
VAITPPLDGKVTLFVELRKMGHDRVGFDHSEAANCSSEGFLVAIVRLNLEELFEKDGRKTFENVRWNEIIIWTE